MHWSDWTWSASYYYSIKCSSSSSGHVHTITTHIASHCHVCMYMFCVIIIMTTGHFIFITILNTRHKKKKYIREKRVMVWKSFQKDWRLNQRLWFLFKERKTKKEKLTPDFESAPRCTPFRNEAYTGLSQLQWSHVGAFFIKSLLVRMRTSGLSKIIMMRCLGEIAEAYIK